MNGTTGVVADESVQGQPTDVIQALSDRKWTILSLIVAGALLGFLTAFLLQRAWRSEVVLVIVGSEDQSSLMSGLSGQLGGIAALTGISLPSEGNRSEYIETLRSNSLSREFFLGGEPSEEFCREKVVRCAADMMPGGKPTEDLLDKMVRKFHRSVLSIDDDKRTGLVRVSITWLDRHIAARWANELVARANARLQARAIEQAERRLEYLRDAVQKTDLMPLRESIYKLMEGQIRSEMMAKTRPDYAFRVIETATPAAKDQYVRPIPALMAALGAACALVFAAVWIMTRQGRRRGKS